MRATMPFDRTNDTASSRCRRPFQNFRKVMVACVSITLLLGIGRIEGAEPAPFVIYDFEDGFDISRVGVNDVVIEVVEGLDGHALQIHSGHSIEWPGIELSPDGSYWDVTGFQRIAMDVVNTGADSVTVALRVDNPGADGVNNCLTQTETLAPGEKRTLKVAFSTTPWVIDPPVQLDGMQGVPGGLLLDPSRIVQMIVFVPQPSKDHVFLIDNIRAEGTLKTLSGDSFFPFVDAFGQFMHDDWPGKLHSESEFSTRKALEAADLEAHPGPADWDRYGGALYGPQLEATGFFRVEKYQGKWWLVDPDGRLFWSHGINCVAFFNDTGISHREHYFDGLPDPDGPYKDHYSQSWWAPLGFYEDKVPYTTFSHRNCNLQRKYGEDWRNAFADIAHLRLRSWGHNTIANWSSPDIYLMRRTPYVATIDSGGPDLEGSEGYWGKFPDVFDPAFRQSVKDALAAKTQECVDPWCIGFFVDNELPWGEELTLALATLASPATQAAKVAFTDDLKAKYVTIAALNAAWGTAYASWDAFLNSTETPDEGKAEEDLRAFAVRTAEQYFRTIKEELSAAAPNHLYLGCRFAWSNDIALRAAVRYCDVVCFNKYERSVGDLRLPDDADKPIIVSEFHFGALDRGMFSPGLQSADSQEDRAALYKDYVRSALDHPLIVGAHWFQYTDQPLTGRGDGENFQIGFLDVTDTPYPELVEASREIGYDMYSRRLGAGADVTPPDVSLEGIVLSGSVSDDTSCPTTINVAGTPVGVTLSGYHGTWVSPSVTMSGDTMDITVSAEDAGHHAAVITVTITQSSTRR